MPALTERELSNVEKLFNATRALLTYTREKRKYEAEQQRRNQLDGGHGSAVRNRAVEEDLPLPSVSPSSVLSPTITGKQQPSGLPSSQQRQDQQQVQAQPSASSTFTGTPNAATERRLWAELAFVFWRIAGLSKLMLLAYVTSDPRGTLEEVGKGLLNYIRDIFQGCQKNRRMEEMAKLGADRLFYMLKKLCSRKMCVLMLGGDTGEGQRLHEALCGHIVAQHHTTWMSLLYVSFCDEAAQRSLTRLYMPSSYVATTSDVLRCLYHACELGTVCAREMLDSEPVSCVTYLLYGIKLRIQRGDLLRPSEADESTLLSEGGAARPIAHPPMLPRRRTVIPPVPSHNFALVDKFNAKRTPVALQAAAAHASARAAASLASGQPSPTTVTAVRAGGGGTGGGTSGYAQVSNQASAGHSDTTNTPALEAATVSADSMPSSSSWGMNLPNLTRQQLGHMMLAGRQNAYDELNHLALDVVVEAVRCADGYQHWAVMSTVASFLALSAKGLEDAAPPQPAPTSSSLELATAAATDGSPLAAIARARPAVTATNTTAVEKTPALTQTTKQVAMYENALDITQLVLALLKGLAVEPRTKDAGSAMVPNTRHPSSSPSSAPAPNSADAVLRGSAEAMNALQQRREMLLQELLKCDFAKHLKTAAYTAPKVVLADRSLLFLVEEFCSLDKTADDLRGPASGSAGDGSTASPAPAFSMANFSFQAGTSYAPAGGGGISFAPNTPMALAAGSSSSNVMGFGGASSGRGGGGGGGGQQPGNLSISVVASSRTFPNDRGAAGGSLVDDSPNASATSQQRRRRSPAPGAGSATKNERPGKENFAKSFFKSFFKGRKEGGNELHTDLEGGAGGEDDPNESSTTIYTPHSPGTFAADGDVSSGDEGEHGGGGVGASNSTYFSSATRRIAAEASTRWSEVPSYVALVREMLGSLNELFVDESVEVELRMATGIILTPVCLRDSTTFDMYEGRVTLKNIIHVLQDQMRRHVSSSGGTPNTTSGRSRRQEGFDTSFNAESSRTGTATSTSTMAATTAVSQNLSVPNFIGFVGRALFSLERAYHVIGVPPLTSEAVELTELPLYFFCADGASQPGTTLERFFTRVVALWARALLAAECDEDMDKRSMQVMLGLLQRAFQRGSLPKDSGAVSSPAVNAKTGKAAAGSGPKQREASAAPDDLGYTMRGGGLNFAATLSVSVGDLVNTSQSGFNSSLFDNGSAHLLSAAGSPKLLAGGNGGVEPGGLSDHENTLAALSHVCTTLLHRQPRLLTADALALFFALFSTQDTSMARLGRECVVSTFELSESYPFFARMIEKQEDVRQVGSLVALLSKYVGSDRLNAETRHERRVWLFGSGCVAAVIGTVVHCLRSPQQYAARFVKLMPQLFRLLSTCEPSQDQSPQLCETNFIEIVSAAIAGLQGLEYFIIVTQAMLDATTCNYGLDRATSAYNLVMIGNFRLSATNCSAIKAIFLELVPALAQHASQRGQDLYTNLIEVFTHVVRFTTNLRSPRLVDFALENSLSDLLPYMELTAEVLEKLPFTGDAARLRAFWVPILTNAPHRSEIHFSVTGGIAMTIGVWPEKGFTVSFYVKYDSTHASVPLLELCSHATPQLAESPASLSVSGGDSVQLLYQGVRTTVNQSHTPQNFKPGAWIHVAVVLSLSNTLTVLLNGFSVGSCAMPYYAPDTEATIHIGVGEKAMNDAFFSVGEIVLWGEALTVAQMEAHIAESDPLAHSPKVRVQEIPRELTGGFAPAPIDERIARFIPHENENQMLCNLVKCTPPFPIVAKIVGRHAAPPQCWVEYHMLWATRGGILRMIEWLHDADTAEELGVTLHLIAETTRRVTLLTTVDARMYLLLDYMLKCNTRLMTPAACDSLLHMGTSTLSVNEEEHSVVTNRLLFEYVLSDCALFAKMPVDTALYLLEHLARMFNPSLCHYARRNVRFVIPHRYVDRLLNTFVSVAVVMPLAERLAVMNVAKQVLIASEMEDAVLSLFTSMAAILTPLEQTIGSLYNPQVKVVLPSLQHTHVKLLPLRTAENLTALLLRSLVECSVMLHSVFAMSFPRVINLSWFTACTGRFADPVSVVFATWLLLDAAQASPALKEELMANQSTVVEALQPHAANVDLVLVLLAVTLGASKHVNLLSQRFSVHEQLDSVLFSFTAMESNTLVAPIFVKVFILHLHATISAGGRAGRIPDHCTSTLLMRHKYLSMRLRRYFSLAKVCGRLMLLIHLKRYRTSVHKAVVRAQRQASRPAGGEHGDAPDAVLAMDNTSFFSGTGRNTPTVFLPPLGTSFAMRGGDLGHSLATAAAAAADEEESEGPPEQKQQHGQEQLRVRSSKYRRAFAALRVCVLLWIPTVVSRYDWIVQPRHRASQQELTKAHAGTLFAVKVFHRFAQQPALLYTFVSSPMQTAALSTLVSFVSKPLLEMKISNWESFLSSINPAPLRELSSVFREEGEGEGAEEAAPAADPLPLSPTSPTAVIRIIALDSASTTTIGTRTETGVFHSRLTPVIEPKSAPAGAAISPLPLSAAGTSASGGEAALLRPMSEDAGLSAAVTDCSHAHQAQMPHQQQHFGEGEVLHSPVLHSPVPTTYGADLLATAATSRTSQLQRQVSATLSNHGSSGGGGAVDPAEAVLAAYARMNEGGSHDFYTNDSISDPPAVETTAMPENRRAPPQQQLRRLSNTSFVGASAASDRSQPSSPPSRTTRGAGARAAAVSGRSNNKDNNKDNENGVTGPLGDAELPDFSLVHSASSGSNTEEQKEEVGQQQAQQSLSTRTDFDVSGQSLRRRQSRREKTSRSSSSPRRAGAAGQGSDRGGSGTDDEENAEDDDDEEEDTASSHSTRNSLSSSKRSLCQHDVLGHHERSSSASSQLLRASSLASVGAGGTSTTTATTTLSSGPALPSLADVARDPTMVFIESYSKVLEAVGDVVRREAVGVLAALIGAALHVLPLPTWIGGPSYGSCGGLLFQMLLVTSSTAAGDDSAATMIRYFLFKVAQKVKEEQGVFPDIRFGHAATSGTDDGASGACAFDAGTSFASVDSAHSQTRPHDSFAASGGGHGTKYFQQQQQQTATQYHQALGRSSSPLGGSGGGGKGSAFSNASFARGSAAMASTTGTSGGGGGGSTSSSLGVSDVFYFNVSHFTELVVDMISINVLDLPTAGNYFLSLLVLCQSWPARYIDQLSGQVLRTCIAVLNRPSTQEATVGLIESIFTLTTLVLRRGYIVNGAIDSLLRVLYRVYASFPPVWMSESDVQRRRDLIALTLRHIVTTYENTKELQKALQVRTLTQRFSLYNDLVKVLTSGTEAEACLAFSKYCEENSSSMETLMAGRPKQKADLALKANIRIRGEYIKRVKIFNANYVSATAIKDGQHAQELRAAFQSHFSSYTANTPLVDASQLHWLTANNCVMRDRLIETSDGRVVREVDEPALVRHYFDAQRNFATVASARRHAEDADDVDVLRATLSEEQVNHIAVLVPPFSIRCRPFPAETPTPFIDPHIRLSPSATTLLRLLLGPNETLRFISNAFRVNGIHATPCLVLLTNTTLKVISFSRVTEDGDIILCEYDSKSGHDATSTSGGGGGGLHSGGGSSVGQLSKTSSAPDLDEVVNGKSFGSVSGGGGGSSGPSFKTKKHTAFSISNMTRQLQRLLLDDHHEKRRQQLVRDGTRVAQSVRQSTSLAYCQLFWMYMVCSIREVRCVHYMHLDTAVLISASHDDGPMLSFVDATQSMNPAARAGFLAVMKELMKSHQCTFSEDAQRAPSLRTMLVRWATGSVSNYEYLAFLNRVAGRTIKDFNQYPVFPWILRDYKSSTLDLESGGTFRDLAFPMGAQTEARRQTVSQFYDNTIEMWQVSEEAQEEVAQCFPFHHGTHYSTSAAVLYFFLRVEPFTTFAKVFQGGDFDIATRLFDSVAACYNSCVLGPADCKELVPEFFYNNMFLLNVDHLALGTKADGDVVDDVKLPPWAKGSVQVFTAVMRYALESEHVMHHLHQWVDLIFGVCRRGPLAAERFNLFQRMTYGEEVASALKSAETPHDIDVIIAEVDNFGQTPMQLFQERHPSHQELEPVKAAMTSTSSNTNCSGGGTASSSALMINTLFASLTNAVGGGGSGGGVGGGGDRAPLPPGGTTANLANPTAPTVKTAGQTYTSAFNREAPKVMRMLVHSLDTPQVCFRLSDIPAQRLLPWSVPTHLLDYFRGGDPAVTSFALMRVPTTPQTGGGGGGGGGAAIISGGAGLHIAASGGGAGGMVNMGGIGGASGAGAATASASGAGASQGHLQSRIACGYRRMVPVGDKSHFVCWHEREGRLMRFSASTGGFLSHVPFDCPEDSGQRITAVSASPRESLILVGVSSGTIYCLYPDTGDRVLHLNTTLCHHKHAVAGFASDAHFGRVVSFTNTAEDSPIVWRAQRFHSSLLYRLDLHALLPCLQQTHSSSSSPFTPDTATTETKYEEDLSVVHVAIDHSSAFSIVITRRSLFIFDNCGLPFGAGSLPAPNVCTDHHHCGDHNSNSVNSGSPHAPTAAVSLASTMPVASSPTPDVPVLEDENGEVGQVVVEDSRPVPFTASMTVVVVYHTMEWAAGMQLFVTGHQDGSLSLWRSMRLPPDTVRPGRIAVVNFHSTLFSGMASQTSTSGGGAGPFVQRSGGGGNPSLNELDGGSGAGANVNLGAVTVIVQEKMDVPHFYVGFKSGATRLLAFDEAIFQGDSDSKRK